MVKTTTTTKTPKKRSPQEILQPGDRLERFERVLAMRDAGAPEWENTFSPQFKFAAEMYEVNRNKVQRKKAA